ncbi:MAG: C1 family peptidase [Muribaculaceae bacterium]|nr:C1 family peptidase [Muribaculaceae bacterium]
MRKFTILALGALLGSSAAFAEAPADSVATDSIEKFVFTDIISLPTTSVKDQNKSGTCWCFAGTSYFEDEILRKGGDSLDISEMYTVRKCYEDKAERFVRLYGQTNLAAGGSIMDVPYVWKRYGAVPEEVYTGLQYGEDKHVHGELDAAIEAYMKVVVDKKNNKKVSPAWRKGLKGILDAYLGEVPETFEYRGKTYTPASYAASLPINTADYVPVTSFTHHPFYETFAVEVPDNWLWAQYYNVPLDELKAIVDNSLEKGYTLVWAADVSEGGFKWNDGVALMPKKKAEADMDGTELSRWVKLSDKDRAASQFDFKGPVEEITVTQELRQEMFDNQETTDDHGMEIVGVATDQNGNRYYKVKNSWDSNQVYDGFFYVSEPFFLAKTVDILVNREAIPGVIAKKLKLK